MCSTCILFLHVWKAKTWKRAHSGCIQLPFTGLHSGGLSTACTPSSRRPSCRLCLCPYRRVSSQVHTRRSLQPLQPSPVSSLPGLVPGLDADGTQFLGHNFESPFNLLSFFSSVFLTVVNFRGFIIVL